MAIIQQNICYFINIGFPIVDKGSILVSPTKEVKPRDKEAEIGKEEYYIFSEPVHGFKEKVYYHTMQPDKDGYVYASIINKNINLGIYVKYSIKELPYFIQWKMLGEGTYVVGMEPANCLVEGRDKAVKRVDYSF